MADLVRLTCPNCAARYEVPQSAVPAEGRDVQCSDCGHTWFARPQAAFKPLASAPRPRPAPKMDPKPYPPEDRQPKAPPLSDDAKSILQQEVSREMAVRKAEAAAAMERQEDLGLDDLPIPAPPQGREALPDIGTIDDKMDAGLDAMEPREKVLAEPTPDATRKRRRIGFQIGFWTAVAVVAGLVALYLLAGPIGQAVPPTAEPLAAYGAWVDGIRSWLSEQANAAQIWLDAQMAPSTDS